MIAGYRRITGEAPMMPRWAFGLWQCRERYRTAAESVAVLDEFRKRGIPVDVIVHGGDLRLGRMELKARCSKV